MLVKNNELIIAIGKINCDGNLKIVIGNNTHNFNIKGQLILHKGKTFNVSIDIGNELIEKYRKRIKELKSKIVEIEENIREITG